MKLLKIAFLIALINYLVVGSMVLALNKLDNKNQSEKLPVPTEIIVSSTPQQTQTPTPTIIPTPKVKALKPEDPFAAIFNGSAPTNKPVVNSTNNSNNNPTSAPVAANNPTSPPQQQIQPTADTRCIITVHGSKYDVTAFRNQHSGGNIFNCGAEMTSVFDSQHPMSFLNKMAQYKI